MKLFVIGSSSSGNCYLLKNNSEVLIIECGIHFDSVMKAVNYNLDIIAGCLLTHSHSDHSKAVKSFIAHGIDVYSSKGTFKELGVEKSHRAKIIKEGIKVRIGNFWVKPFKINHDTAEPFGFLIHHSECGNVVFITDTYYVNYRFKNLNQIIVEANYDEDIIEEAMIDVRTEYFVRNRVIGSHMSLQTCKDFLKANDLSTVNNIVLIHLSNNNSNEAMFKSEIESLTGKTVTIADKGTEIDFNINPF